MNETTETTEQTETSEAPVEEKEAPAAEKATKGSSSKLWVVVGLLVLLGALAYGFNTGLFGGNGSSDDSGVSAADATAAVARIDGVEITRGELNTKMTQVKSTFPAGMADIGDEAAFEQVVLNEIINVHILTEEAKARDYTASDADVDAEIAQLAEMFGGEEAFNTQLETAGLSVEELRENMRNEIMIRQLVDANTDIKEVSVTDEELQQAYDEAIATISPEEAPSFDEISEMLRTQLLQQKSVEVINAYIDMLREGKNIEILI